MKNLYMPVNMNFHTVHGVLKARILKWFAIPFSSGPHFVMSGCESWTIKKAECQRFVLLNCDVGEDSQESLGLQGDQTS